MTKSKKDPIREERIHNEVVVDAYGAEEQAMGWYYYLEDKIRFPFQAKCVVAKVVSPLLKGETVQVQGMAPEDACSADMLVLIRWQGRSMAVPLSQLLPIKRNKATNEAIADWHYWGGPRLLLLSYSALCKQLRPRRKSVSPGWRMRR